MNAGKSDLQSRIQLSSSFNRLPQGWFRFLINSASRLPAYLEITRPFPWAPFPSPPPNFCPVDRSFPPFSFCSPCFSPLAVSFFFFFFIWLASTPLKFDWTAFPRETPLLESFSLTVEWTIEIFLLFSSSSSYFRLLTLWNSSLQGLNFATMKLLSFSASFLWSLNLAYLWRFFSVILKNIFYG